MKKSIITVLLLIVCSNVSLAQESDQLFIEVLTDEKNGNDFVAGIYNYFKVYVREGEAVRLDQIEARFITTEDYLEDRPGNPIEVREKGGRFFIHPKEIGIIELQINRKEGIEKQAIGVVPIRAVCYLGGKKSGAISAKEIAAQKGIIASIECCGFDARCKVMSYELIRISRKNKAQKIVNEGAKFNETALRIIQKAKAGDIYIIRQITYRCPATETLKAEDMFFELRD